ncbi:eukaryotic translation initiation factor 3 subunit A-like [Drosophila pseudoobscura]|uniref:Eukaryotic translation initiation factor 3 subunit A-like n=1 Tax=Drosophila pseudoobscura pseudoobscura TaxID=46245 RepID=A0A6I8WB96_DROPS|nr:eukaryotic translation initiation factor 3 subunit A-like [Drosophila pseudoobscura]
MGPTVSPVVSPGYTEAESDLELMSWEPATRRKRAREAKREEPRTSRRKEPHTKREEPQISRREEPRTSKREEPHTGKREEPRTSEREEPHTGKREDHRTSRREEPRTGKREEPHTGKREEPRTSKREKPHSSKREERPEGGRSGRAETRKEESAYGQGRGVVGTHKGGRRRGEGISDRQTHRSAANADRNRGQGAADNGGGRPDAGKEAEKEAQEAEAERHKRDVAHQWRVGRRMTTRAAKGISSSSSTGRMMWASGPAPQQPGQEAREARLWEEAPRASDERDPRRRAQPQPKRSRRRVRQTRQHPAAVPEVEVATDGEAGDGARATAEAKKDEAAEERTLAMAGTRPGRATEAGPTGVVPRGAGGGAPARAPAPGIVEAANSRGDAEASL